jgi:hypothetical protein
VVGKKSADFPLSGKETDGVNGMEGIGRIGRFELYPEGGGGG